jgi:hypothetical protein
MQVLKNFIVMRPGAEFPVGTVITGAWAEIRGGLYAECDGRWLQEKCEPHIFAVLGLQYTLPPDNEGPFRKWVRRVLRLPGPWEHHVPGWFRLPDMRPGSLVE